MEIDLYSVWIPQKPKIAPWSCSICWGGGITTNSCRSSLCFLNKYHRCFVLKIHYEDFSPHKCVWTRCHRFNCSALTCVCSSSWHDGIRKKRSWARRQHLSHWFSFSWLQWSNHKEPCNFIHIVWFLFFGFDDTIGVKFWELWVIYDTILQKLKWGRVH